jgi:transcriptional regulator with XRE-family HTH domain
MTAELIGIGKRVKAQRKQRQMTQATIAERIGVSNVYISNVENGIKGISLDVLLRLAREFDISLDSLVFEEPHIRLPKVYRKLADVLTSCDASEIEQVFEMVSDYLKMIRADKV